MAMVTTIIATRHCLLTACPGTFRIVLFLLDVALLGYLNILARLNRCRLWSMLMTQNGNVWRYLVHSQQRTARVRIEQNGEEIVCLLWTDQDKQSVFHSTRSANPAKLKAILVRALFMDCSELLKQPAEFTNQHTVCAFKCCRKVYST